VAKKTGVDPAAKEGCSLWVRNIATTTRANDLKTHFSQFGAVLSAKIVAHPKDRDKHYGIITMQDPDDAAKCIQSLHRTELHGRLILVEKGKQDTNQIVSGGVKKQPATNTKPASSSTQISRTVKKSSSSTVSTSNRKTNPKTEKKPLTKTVFKSSHSKPSPVHPPSVPLSTTQHRRNSRSAPNPPRTSQKSGTRKETKRQTSNSTSASKSERIVQLSDERDEKRVARLSTRHGRDVQRNESDQRHSNLEIREPDLRERLGPPVRQPLSVQDRLGPRVGYERRALFDPEEDQRIR
jgi:RNA recognition motif-containing protein